MIALSGGCPLACCEGCMQFDRYTLNEDSTAGLRERLPGSSDGTHTSRPRRWLLADDGVLARFGSFGPSARPDSSLILFFRYMAHRSQLREGYAGEVAPECSSIHFGPGERKNAISDLPDLTEPCQHRNRATSAANRPASSLESKFFAE